MAADGSRAFASLIPSVLRSPRDCLPSGEALVTSVLVIHYDKSIRSRLEMLAGIRHEVDSAKNVVAGIKQLAKRKPDVIIIGHDKKKEEGVRLLRYMRDNTLRIPVVVVISPGAGSSQPLLMKLGAKGFVEYPVDQDRLDQAIADAMEAHRVTASGPPAITPEELNSNISQLETALNRAMKCFAGKNLVFIQAMILGGGTTKPRICLKCPLRAEYGLNREVYYEFIRDVCCRAPSRCEAVQLFEAARESA